MYRLNVMYVHIKCNECMYNVYIYIHVDEPYCFMGERDSGGHFQDISPRFDKPKNVFVLWEFDIAMDEIYKIAGL